MNMEDLHRLLRTSHVQTQVDSFADPMLVLDEGLCVRNANGAFFDTFKVDRSETIGKPIYELGNGQWDIPELRRLLVDVIPNASAVIDFKVEHDFAGLGRKTMLLTARTLSNPDNRSHTMLLCIVDATATVRWDAAKDMVFGELRHRMRNLLSVAQSLVGQTSADDRSADEYREEFLSRFSALIEAQDIAFGEHDGDSLSALVESTLAPYAANPEAIAIKADTAFELDPRTLLSLSLVLHELATNAAKYGALSLPGGRVSVSWKAEDANGQLRLKWVESGGPSVTPTVSEGYGTRLINSVTIDNLGGQVKQEYASEGLRTEICFPIGGDTNR